MKKHITTARRSNIEVQMMEDMLAEASEIDYRLYSQILHEVILFAPKDKLQAILNDYEDKVYGEVE